MKILLISLLSLASIPAAAQINTSIKANVLFPVSSASWKDIVTTSQQVYDSKGENSAGWNVGLSVQVNTPTSLYVMPELYYTTFSNKFTDPATNTTLEAKTHRVDLPVLLGYKLFGNTLSAFVGPVASINVNGNETYDQFVENAKKSFTVGLQFGLQAEFSKFLVNGRYEGAFSKDQRTYTNQAVGSNYTVSYDNRPSYLSFGLGYKF